MEGDWKKSYRHHKNGNRKLHNVYPYLQIIADKDLLIPSIAFSSLVTTSNPGFTIPI
jgi:hypothetical protein